MKPRTVRSPLGKALKEHNRKYEGKSIVELARSTGTIDPLDAFFDLAGVRSGALLRSSRDTAEHRRQQ